MAAHSVNFSAPNRCGVLSTHVLWGVIWHPGDKGDLAALALTTIGVVLDIEDSVSATHDFLALLVLALGAEKLLAEFGVVWVGRGLLNDNLLPVVGDLVDDPLGRLAELQVVERLDTLRCDRDAVYMLLSVEGSSSPIAAALLSTVTDGK